MDESASSRPSDLVDPSTLPLAAPWNGLIDEPDELYADAEPSDVLVPVAAEPDLEPPVVPGRHGRRRADRRPSRLTARRSALSALVHARCRAVVMAMPKPGVPRPAIVRTAAVGALCLVLVGASTTGTSPFADPVAEHGPSVGAQDEKALLAMDARDRTLLAGPASQLLGALGAPAAPSGSGASGTQSATGTAPAVDGAPLVGGQDLAVDGALNLIKPVRGAVEGSGFGMRYHPVLHVWKMHNGTDFPVACGTPVYASAAGVVTLAQYHGASGNAVEIDHGDLDGGGAGSSFATHYFHLSAFGVRAGDHVVQGQFIGVSGTTGRSTGCHLHWEVMIDGRYVDPMSVIGNGEPVYGTQAPAGEPQQTWSEPLPAEDEQYKKDAERDGDPEGASPAAPVETPSAPAPAAPAPETPTEPAHTQRPTGPAASGSTPAATTPAAPPSTTSPAASPSTTTPVEPPRTTAPPVGTPSTVPATTAPPTEPPTATPSTTPPTTSPSTPAPTTSAPACPDPTAVPTATPTAEPSGEPSATPDCASPAPTADPVAEEEPSERR